MEKVIILGTEVGDASQKQALMMAQEWMSHGNDQHYITTPNPEIVLAAAKDKELRSIINHSDLSLADGFGLKIGAWILGQKLEHRIAGADFMLDVCALAEKAGLPIFLLGGRDSHHPYPSSAFAEASADRSERRGCKSTIAFQAAEKLRALCPSIKIVGSESGGDIENIGGEWISSDAELINKINQSKAKILFVAFGCPKQEKWIYHNLAKLDTVNLAMTVGGSFDYLAGTARRSPLVLRQTGLEWLWRLVREPRRAGRIWNATVRFVYQIIICKIKIVFVYRHNVVGFITNDRDEVLLVQRANEKYEHWQLPQGGVDKGENEEQAVLREMREEVGTDDLQFLGKNPKKYTYNWPIWHQRKGQYRGQRQTIFYLHHQKSNQDIKIDENEIKDFQWTPIDDVLSIIHHYRQPMTKMAIEGYREITKN